MIRWTKGDAIKLGRAVADFNRKVNFLLTEESKLYLPELREYKELRKDIKTRSELNRIIKSLRRFTSSDTAQEIYITEAGEKLTKWEKRELTIMSATAQRRITQELKGFDKVAQPYKTQEEKQLEAQRKNLRQLEKLKGADFKRIKERIENVGRLDYSYRRALQFQLNYIKEMEKYKDYDNYEILKNKMESIKDPEAFYNYVKDKDLLVDLTYQSDEMHNQEMFNFFVEMWNDNQYFEMPETINTFSFDD